MSEPDLPPPDLLNLSDEEIKYRRGLMTDEEKEAWLQRAATPPAPPPAEEPAPEPPAPSPPPPARPTPQAPTLTPAQTAPPAPAVAPQVMPVLTPAQKAATDPARHVRTPAQVALPPPPVAPHAAQNPPQQVAPVPPPGPPDPMVDIIIHPPEGVSFRNRAGGEVACKVRRSRVREVYDRMLQQLGAYVAVYGRQIAAEEAARQQMTAQVTASGEVVVQRPAAPAAPPAPPAEVAAAAPFANIKDVLNIPRCPTCLTAKPPGERRCAVCEGPI